jgi:hypothetical protein
MPTKTDCGRQGWRGQQQYEVRVPFSISLYEEDEGDGATTQIPVTLVGHTHSIGVDTLSLVGPFYHFGYRYLMGRDRTLQIVLHLPDGTVDIQGFPVRYTQMSDNETGGGYLMTGLDLASRGEMDVNCLIDVNILVMSESDGAQFLQYLDSLVEVEEEGTAPPPVLETRRGGASFRAAL